MIRSLGNGLAPLTQAIARVVQVPRAVAGRLGRAKRRTKILVGGAAVLTVVAAVGVIASPRGQELLQGLPGVELVTGPLPPRFVRSISGLPAPMSVAVTADGSVIYVAEGRGERVIRRVRAEDGATLAELFPPGTTAGERQPVSVAIGPAGQVYAVDRTRLEVDMYNQQGEWLGLLPRPEQAAGWEPLAVDTDREGNVYVTNTAEGGPAVAVYSAEGLLKSIYPVITASDVTVVYAAGVAVGPNGKLFISDSNNGRMVELDPGSTLGEAYGNTTGDHQLAVPRGLAFDGKGRCIVVDATDHLVSVWDVQTEPVKMVFTFGGEGIADGNLLFPNDISVDEKGDIYIADRDNDRVQIWRY